MRPSSFWEYSLHSSFSLDLIRVITYRLLSLACLCLAWLVFNSRSFAAVLGGAVTLNLLLVDAEGQLILCLHYGSIIQPWKMVKNHGYPYN